MGSAFHHRRVLGPSFLRVLTGTLLAGFCLFDATAVTAGTSAHLWSHGFGDATSQAGTSIGADASGNVFVAGYFNGTINLGGSDLVATGPYNSNAFLAKFDAAGVHLWSKSFSSNSVAVGASELAVDASGNVIIVGTYEGTVNFGGSELPYSSGKNVFVAKFDSAGAHLWSYSFGDLSLASHQYGYGVAVDASGNVVIAGKFYDNIDFGGGTLISAGFEDAFVAMFSGTGAYQWSQRFGDADRESSNFVAVDNLGNVLLIGGFYGAINFGGATLTSAGDSDIFVAKFNSSGVHQWSQGFGGLGRDSGTALVADASGGVSITGGFGGFFDGTVDFGGGTLTSAGAYDIFVAKFSSAGVHQWSQRFGDALDQVGYSIATDASENVIVTGYVEGPVNFGGSVLPAPGAADAFVAKFSGEGIHQWSQRFGDASDQVGSSVAVDVSGKVMATGWFRGTVNFGGGDLTSAGGEDIFTAKFAGASAEPTLVDIVDVGNDQGGRVKIRFTPSGLDDPLAGSPIDYYEAYRGDGTMPIVWTLAGEIPAHVSTEYLMAAPTLLDSTVAEGQHFSPFFIRAVTTSPVLFYDSEADSGYSLDNLAPGIPTGFAFAAGMLSWDGPRTADFDHFSVYGSNNDSFGSAIMIDHTVTPLINVVASPYAYYFVTATDVSGNEGNAAVVDGFSGTGETPKSYVLSVSAYPNPFNPSTTVRFTIPAKGRVTIAVYDARGARIATLLDEEKPAGAYAVPWDGRSLDGSGASSGVYFARLEFGGEVRAYKMVILK